uniref:Translation elongation factor EFTu/EF1A C-terminal domain-containing protein n=1 Tax=Globodera rostochiensis TaxID=31243 RepID=A0A914HL37_GLORO
MDDPTVNWDVGRYNQIQEELTPYLKRCGFNPKSDIMFMPCSGLCGAFLKERPSSNICPWYTGMCFLEYIDSLPPIARDFDGPVRGIIANKFSDMGTIVFGKLESGVILKGQTLVLMPNRVPVQILNCWVNDTETDQLYAGDSFQLKIKGVEDTEIMPGFVLCTTESSCPVGRVFDAEVLILDYKSIITSGFGCVLHIHEAVEEVIVKAVICTIDKKDANNKKRTKFVKQDDKCILRLESNGSIYAQGRRKNNCNRKNCQNC